MYTRDPMSSSLFKILTLSSTLLQFQGDLLTEISVLSLFSCQSPDERGAAKGYHDNITYTSSCNCLTDFFALSFTSQATFILPQLAGGACLFAGTTQLFQTSSPLHVFGSFKKILQLTSSLLKLNINHRYTKVR